MAEIEKFIVVSESVRFMSNGITVRRGQVIDKDHPCFNLILPYPNGYENENPARNRFKAVRCGECQDSNCEGCKAKEKEEAKPEAKTKEKPEAKTEEKPEEKKEAPKAEAKEEQPKQKKTAPVKGK